MANSCPNCASDNLKCPACVMKDLLERASNTQSDGTVTVTWGEEVFCPRPYQSFRIGPLSMTTKIKPGETEEQAILRAWHALEATARVIYPQKRAAFFERLNQKEEGVF